MDECFRFLINIDHCLNMSCFDIFFYKLQSEKKYKLNQVQMFDKEGTSLRSAISDIRTYLNKYPYHFKEYQFVVAMRSTWQQQTNEWLDTLLYRLTQLIYELHNESIYMNVATKVDRALNLIMLYEADASCCETNLDNYMSGNRLFKDYMLLFSKMGLIDEEALTLENLKEAYRKFKHESFCDAATCYMIETFINEQDKILHIDKEKMELDSKTFYVSFSSFLNSFFANFQVMELMIPRDLQYSPREDRLALLKIVDFINKSVEVKSNVDVIPRLTERCKINWNETINDDTLENKYSDMLFNYEKALTYVYNQLDKEVIAPVYATVKLPQYSDKKRDNISAKDSPFEGDDKKTDLTEILRDFLRNHLTIRTARTKWSEAYNELRRDLDNLGDNLKKYADSLSLQYSEKIEKRKKEALSWDKQIYFADEDTKNDIKILAQMRDSCLEELKNPQMTPSLRFQDQINMENALQYKDSEIRKLIRCLEASTALNFVVSVLVLLALVVTHYTVLQPFVFTDTVSLLAYLGYIGIVLFLLTFSWCFPRIYYTRQIKKSVKSLIESMDLYLPGYYMKAKLFKNYINALNLLDVSIKYHTLYVEAFETHQCVVQGYLWHKTQIKDHLTKLKVFRGLIDYGYNPKRNDAFDERKYSLSILLSSKDKVKSVEDCSLYWPQGESK